MDLSVASLLAFLVGLVALYIIGLLLVIPLKFLIKLLINAIIGGVLLFIFNMIAGLFGLSIIINPFNALIVGILGIRAGTIIGFATNIIGLQKSKNMIPFSEEKLLSENFVSDIIV